MTVVDNAVYVDGRRTADPTSPDETYEPLRERNGMAWIGLYRRHEAEIRSVAAESSCMDCRAGHGSGGRLYTILDQVVDEYAPVVAGQRQRQRQRQQRDRGPQLFVGDPAVSRRIHDLSRAVIEFSRAAAERADRERHRGRPATE